ncbi:Os08g0123600 [Oryza sativa Japonica Group]|uniref:Os08g0123600 protein n=1 Tax=Oryza sativa subsp. japonica TaxID=39947 RepID=A0A0P0XB86_ORYSJ|nr:hypothetical protein EE612_041861 [Oryza sativa]BAT03623.1 Os08g0123600 [Oryza sativa Japonica Group]
MRRNNDIFLGQIKRCRRSYSNLQEESKSLSLSFLSFQVGDEPVRDAAGVIVAAMTISEPSPLPSRLIRPPSSTFINISISSQMDSSIHLQIIQEATPKKVLMATTGKANLDWFLSFGSSAYVHAWRTAGCAAIAGVVA